jgi:aryl-alcohol dehydrogenase-like predicted oxidoreductase
LGRTGLKVSEVGMGASMLPGPEFVRAALDAGINYFDTARRYGAGNSEIVLGKGLKGRRKEAVVATKCSLLRRKQALIESAEASLKALQTDVIDVFQLHQAASRQDVLHGDHLEALAELRRAGKVRFTGVTTHFNMVEVMDAAVEAGVYDVVLTGFNFKSPPEVVAAAERAAAAGLGVVAMKVMTGGYAAPSWPGLNPFQSALRWVLRHRFVSAAIIDMLTFEEIEEDAAVIGTEHAWRDEAVLRMYSTVVDGRYCRACGACVPQCPHGFDVPTAMRALMYAEGYGRPSLARETLTGLVAGGQLPCSGCPTCTVRCRFGLQTPERMAAVVRLAGGRRG